MSTCPSANPFTINILQSPPPPYITPKIKKSRTPLPPSKAMCVLIKDLQRSVVDVCANKRLSGNRTQHFNPIRRSAYGVIPSSEGPAFAFRIWLCFSLRLCVESLYVLSFPLFFPIPKNCTIMHFSRFPRQKLHYNALFHPKIPPYVNPIFIPKIKTTTLHSLLSLNAPAT
jgi:hypothetical protein